ncbi:glycosyltransferase [Rhodovibrionaceae bacterium A322]
MFDSLKDYPQIYFTYLLRKDLRQNFPVGHQQGIEAFLRWWDQKGAATFGRDRQGRDLLARFNWDVVSFDTGSQTVELPRMLRDCWLSRPKLQGDIPADRATFVADLESWYAHKGITEVSSLAPDNSELLLRVLMSEEDSAFLSLLDGWFSRLQSAPQAFSVYVQRPDLRKNLPLGQEEGVENFLRWWDSQGEEIYGPDRQGLDLMEEFNWEDTPFLFNGNAAALPRLWRDIWLARPDLQSNFDVKSKSFYSDFNSWYLSQGINEIISASLLSPNQKRGLFASLTPEDLSAEGAAASFLRKGPGLSRYACLLWRLWPDLQAAFDLRTHEGRVGLQAWSFTRGCESNRGLELLTDHWLDYLLEDREGGEDGHLPLPNYLQMVWLQEEDLKQSFDLSQPEGVAGLTSWFASEGHRRFPRLAALCRERQSQTKAGVNLRSEAWIGEEGGVNVIGNARSETGMGEVMRTVALALEAQQVPLCVVDVSPGDIFRQEEQSVEHLIVDQPRYRTTIFCLSAMGMAGLYTTRHQELFKGRYNIGYWHWEFPKWPENWKPAFDLVDEVWAPCQFALESYEGVTDKKLATLPASVNIEQVEELPRSYFGLPEDRFVYLFVFDSRSFLMRKNPWAALEAFQMAFPDRNTPVSLVIKVNNSDPSNPLWKAFVEVCARDPRVRIIDKTLYRSEILALIKSCDVLLSLHRCEGFGFTMAEALLLGTEVIATHYSGNRDFISEENAYPVSYTLETIPAADHQFGEGQHWATPDLDHAAAQIQLAYQNRNKPPRHLATTRENGNPFSLEIMGKTAVELLEGRV